MNSATTSPIEIRTSAEEVPSIPPPFAEVVVLARYFSQQGYLDAISQRVRLARGRAGTFDVLDFVAILLGYAVSGEPTLQAFFEKARSICASFHGTLWPRARAPSLDPESLPGCYRSSVP